MIVYTKRFLAFAYMQYYPGGGMSDCFGEFDTLSEAIAACKNEYADDHEIFDRESGQSGALHDWTKS